MPPCVGCSATPSASPEMEPGRTTWPAGPPSGPRVRYEGRPLFAAHAGLAWPDAPHLVLWHAQTLLREFRGDGHITALVDADLDPVEALVMHLASGEVPGTFLRDSRGWPDADVGRRRVPPGRPRPGRGGATDRRGVVPGADRAGASLRQEIEDVTDRLAVFPYEALGEEACAELRTLTRPFSRAVVDAAGLGR